MTSRLHLAVAATPGSLAALSNIMSSYVRLYGIFHYEMVMTRYSAVNV